MTAKEVPSDWEKGNITSIFKKYKDDDYQPVSFTSMLRKIMEQTLLEDTSKYMKDREGIRNSQYGCTKDKSFLINLVAF